MIHIYSIQQALSLKGVIPEPAIIRSIQLMGDDYSPEEHGHIVVISLTKLRQVCSKKEENI